MHRYAIANLLALRCLNPCLPPPPHLYTFRVGSAATGAQRKRKGGTKTAGEALEAMEGGGGYGIAGEATGKRLPRKKKKKWLQKH